MSRKKIFVVAFGILVNGVFSLANAQQPFLVIAENASVKYERNVDISAPASGLISELPVEEGNKITKGDVIVNMDQRIANAELEVAVQEAIAAEKQAEDDSNILYANKVSEVATAEYETYLELLRRGATNSNEVRRKKLEAEKSKLSIRVAELEQTKNKAAALVSKEKVKAAEVQLALRRIVAPFDGIVSHTHLKQDAWAKEGERILTLIAMEDLRVEGIAKFGSEKVAPHNLLGAPVTIEITVAKGEAPEIINGTIGFVSPVLYGSGEGARVWAKIKNKETSPGSGNWLFSEGMTSRMKIEIGKSKSSPTTEIK